MRNTHAPRTQMPSRWKGAEPTSPVPRGQLVRDDAYDAWQALREAAHGQELPCSGDPDGFYPDPQQTKRTARAVQLCRSCPVMAECRDFSVANQERYGVWGGLTEDERVKVVRRERRERDKRQRAA